MKAPPTDHCVSGESEKGDPAGEAEAAGLEGRGGVQVTRGARPKKSAPQDRQGQDHRRHHTDETRVRNHVQPDLHRPVTCAWLFCVGAWGDSCASPVQRAPPGQIKKTDHWCSMSLGFGEEGGSERCKGWAQNPLITPKSGTKAPKVPKSTKLRLL